MLDNGFLETLYTVLFESHLYFMILDFTRKNAGFLFWHQEAAEIYFCSQVPIYN